jgi:adenylate cyclase
MERRLAAILCADVVGYSRLMEADEEATIRALSACRDKIDKLVANHHGRVFGSAGDSVIAEFASPVEAVGCAADIQRDLEKGNADLPEDRRMQLRIGVNLGDVVVEGDDLLGDGVNVAARLQSLADPGGIYLSGTVFDQVDGKLDLTFDDRGAQEVKNIAKPVRVYSVGIEVHGSAAAARASKPLPLPDKPSIAVLPFENMSGDPEQEYFSDGITEDIITALSQISGLSVASRLSTMHHKSVPIDAKQIGSDQGVRYVLEGSVRKVGRRIRINAQLSDGTTGHHLWADRYDRELDDIFAVQDDITHQITVEMRVHLSEGEKVRVLAGRTNSVEAWERLIRADELTNTLVEEDNLEARRLLEEAVQIDPSYAAAWTQLANTFVGDVFMGRSESREGALKQALYAAQKALDIEEEYPTALTILGYVHLFRGNHDSAVDALLKAVAREPRNAEIVATCAFVLVFAGQVDDALEMIRKAMRLSPISPMWYLVCLGMCYHSRGQQNLAISTLREAVAMEPESAFARPYLISALVETGSLDEANQIAREVIRIEPGFTLSSWPGADFKDESVKARIVDNLVKAGLSE